MNYPIRKLNRRRIKKSDWKIFNHNVDLNILKVASILDYPLTLSEFNKLIIY